MLRRAWKKTIFTAMSFGCFARQSEAGSPNAQGDSRAGKQSSGYGKGTFSGCGLAGLEMTELEPDFIVG